MARIELKYCTIHLRDGLKGTAVGPTTPPIAGATSLTGLSAVATNRPYLSTVIPIGARLRVAGETTPIDHVVTARVDGSGTGGVNEVQTAAVVNATGGTFKLLWNGAETPEIAYNAAAVDVAAALAPGLVGATANISVTAIFAIVAPVNLGSTANFAVLAGYAITNVPTSAIIGDVGVSPAAESFITGFSQTDWTGYATSPQVTGKIYGADMTDPTPAMLTTAKGDLTIAYNDAAGRTPMPAGPFLNPGSGDLAGLNLAPGLYKFTGAAIATTSFTLTGGENDVWIFQIASALTVSNGVHVTLAGGAQASNIFWQVGTAAIFGTTSVFQGTVMANASITLKTGATLNGRALAFSGTVALDSNIITVPGAASTAAKDWQLYY